MPAWCIFESANNRLSICHDSFRRERSTASAIVEKKKEKNKLARSVYTGMMRRDATQFGKLEAGALHMIRRMGHAAKRGKRNATRILWRSKENEIEEEEGGR